ncbi:MAG: CotH kinase family protein [Verrucomicrobia bacterium]|nr:CotH kinase family protein [Verrucomicrobiota bacterium]
MTRRRFRTPRAREANRANAAVHAGSAALLLLLAAAFSGCGSQEDSAKVTPQPPARNRQAALSNSANSKSVPAVQQRLSEPASDPSANAPSGTLGPAHAQDKSQNSKLPLYELVMDPKSLANLERTAYSNNTQPGKFIADGEVYDRVQVRYRGAWARSWPKKPLKIIFDKEKPFDGQSRLNLNSGWRDPAFVREHLAYHLYAVCGVPASRSRMVRVHVNGQFRGLYIEVEQPEKAFAARLHLKGATIYKASSRSNQADERDLGDEAAYRVHYEQETQKDTGYAELQRFCHDLARATNVADFFRGRVDLEKYINYLAVSVLIQNWDAYNKNHFIVYDGKGSKKWFVVPWDLDRTLGDHWNGPFDEARLPIAMGTQQVRGITGWNRMFDRFYSDLELRSRLLRRLGELIEKEFTKEKLFPIIDRLESEIATEAALDRRRWPGPTPDLRTGIAQLKRYIERRRAYLLDELGKAR